MHAALVVPDRRLPFSAVLGDCVASVLAFPVATLFVAPELLEDEATRTVLAVLPWALILLNMVVILFDPPEPPVWSVPRAVVAGVWRATLLFIGLLWVLVLSAEAAAVPVGLFMIAWGCLTAAMAILRTARLLAARRIPV
jgi:hypothetical protein